MLHGPIASPEDGSIPDIIITTWELHRTAVCRLFGDIIFSLNRGFSMAREFRVWISVDNILRGSGLTVIRTQQDLPRSGACPGGMCRHFWWLPIPPRSALWMGIFATVHSPACQGTSRHPSPRAVMTHCSTRGTAQTGRDLSRTSVQETSNMSILNRFRWGNLFPDDVVTSLTLQ